MDKKMGIAVALTLIGGSLALVKAGAENRQPLKTVAGLDIKRYLGTWYEIAKLPNRFEKGCIGEVTANYQLRPDQNIQVINRCRQSSGSFKESKGVARVVDKTTNAKLKVTFFWPFSGDYQVIDLGPDYEYAVVGEPSRKYLWVLSRTPQMDEGKYREILQRAAAQGFDVNRMQKTSQLAN